MSFSFPHMRMALIRKTENNKCWWECGENGNFAHCWPIMLEKALAPHSSTLAWKLPWTEEPSGLQSMGSLRVGHNWATSLSLSTFHFHALEKEMATHSSVLAWRIPWTEKPGRLQSMGSHRVGHNWSDFTAAAAGTSLMVQWLRLRRCRFDP